jgi:hypothetical protein
MSFRNSLNSICPYYTMFPLDFPLRVLARARRGQVVADPFCGRGTTLFAARQKSLLGYGIDTSPVATAISRAKLFSATAEDVLEAYDSLMQDIDDQDVPEGEFWQMAFHEETMATLCRLRQALIDTEGVDEPAAISILRGIALGALHGPLNKSGFPSSFFSNQMMRTFAPKPDYAVKFWKERDLLPPFSDVREVIKRRANRFLKEIPGDVQGAFVYHGDARLEDSYEHLPGLIDWVVTSPPYYGMRTYEVDQWLRLWFIGGPEHPVYTNQNQLQHSDQETFVRDLASVWDHIAEMASPDICMIIRFGAIGSRKADYTEILHNSLDYSMADWRHTASRRAGHSGDGKRQSIAMGKRGQSSTVEERDFYVRLQH